MEYKLIIDNHVVICASMENLPPEYAPGVCLLLAILPEGYDTGKNYTLDGVGYIYRCIWSEAFEIEFEDAYRKQLEGKIICQSS